MWLSAHQTMHGELCDVVWCIVCGEGGGEARGRGRENMSVTMSGCLHGH